MFSGKKGVMNPNTTDTLVGEGSVFEGRLRSEAGIRIEGQINGDVVSNGDVTVGERGVVRSNITARGVVIAGEVHGDVICQGRVSIRPTGRLYGNTNAVSLVIEEGGVFHGMSRTDGVSSNAGSTPEWIAASPGSNQKQAAVPFGGGPKIVL